jgi:hypothetical protein
MGGYIYQIMIIILAFLISQSLNIKQFSVIFNGYVYILSIISILVFIAANSFSWILDYFPIQENTAETKFTNLYISGIFIGVDEIRNNCIFREPGVFMIYLLLGVIFELFYSVNVNMKHIFFYFIALATTFSTAAFIILILISIGYLFTRNTKKLSKNKIIIISFVAIIVITFSYFPAIFFRIYSKIDIDSTSYGSLIARVASVIVNYDIFVTNPIVGSGLRNYGNLFETYSMQHFGFPLNAEGQSTNSFMSIFATYGFMYGSIIVFAFIGLTKIFTREILLKFILLLSLILMFSNEDMRYSLLFCVLIFFGLNIKPKIMDKNMLNTHYPINNRTNANLRVSPT